MPQYYHGYETKPCFVNISKK